jgi:hypothetical protein
VREERDESECFIERNDAHLAELEFAPDEVPAVDRASEC